MRAFPRGNLRRPSGAGEESRPPGDVRSGWYEVRMPFSISFAPVSFAVTTHLAPPIGTREVPGLGVVMMRQAARLAFDLGLEGRVGLHSKPESEGFYRRVGMTAMLREEAGDGTWLYFESEPSASRRLLESRDADPRR